MEEFITENKRTKMPRKQFSGMLLIFPLLEEKRMLIPSYPNLKPSKGALKNSDILASVPWGLCHLEMSKSNRLSKEAFDDRAEKDGCSRNSLYLQFWKKSFSVGHINATEGSQSWIILKSYIFKRKAK